MYIRPKEDARDDVSFMVCAKNVLITDFASACGGKAGHPNPWASKSIDIRFYSVFGFDPFTTKSG